MSIEKNLERIADALERIAASNERATGLVERLETPPVEPEPETPAEVPPAEEKPATAPETSETPKKGGKLSRAEIKKRLTELGVEYKDGARTYTLEAMLEEAEAKAAEPSAVGSILDDEFRGCPVEAAPAEEPEEPEEEIPQNNSDMTHPAPAAEVSHEEVVAALAPFVVLNGRDAGVSLLVECGADPNEPKISDLDAAGRAKALERMKK